MEEELYMDHKQLLASLDDDTRLRLTERSDRAGLIVLAGHLAAILATGLWIAAGIGGWQGVLVVHGVQLVFLFTLLHETVHDTPFRDIRLNRLVGWLCGFVIVLPPTWFRYFHLAHHRHTHDRERDPELQGKPVDSLFRYLQVVSGVPVWLFHFRTLVENALGRIDQAYVPHSGHKACIREARIMILVYAVLLAASVVFSSTLLLWLWVIPVLLGQPFLRLYLMAEHGRCPHVANMLENSRTTHTTRLVRWLAWNMPYHAEHHAYPMVPFHKLPDFHEVAKRHLRSTENGYTAFHDKQIKLLREGDAGELEI